MPAFVYVLRCADGSLYIGWTTDLDRRVRAHRASRASKYTRSRLPVELAGWFAVPNPTQARRLEAKLKALPRSRKLELLASAEKPAGSRVRHAPAARAPG
jgi:putative endonuclease